VWLVEEQALAINFSGEFTTPRSPDEVFDFLSDPNKFGPLLPDFQSMSMQDATHFTVKVKVGVGNIRGSAEIKMELAEAVKPSRAEYRGQGTAVGSQVRVSAGFDLQPLPESTRVVWKGETSVFGKLASMAGGMLEPLGRKNIQKLIDGLQKALAEPVTEPALAEPVAATEPTYLPQSGMTENALPCSSDIPQSGISDELGASQLSAPTMEAPGVSSPNEEPDQGNASVPADGTPTEGNDGKCNP